jgi:ribosomal protein RSM22 (predicted rRNA methylase)
MGWSAQDGGPLLAAAADVAAELAADVAGPGGLRRGYGELSERYRRGDPTPAGARLTAGQVGAYLVARLPATLAAAGTVLGEVAARRPGWRPATVLDLGAGPGTATWAAAAVFPSLRQATLVEHAAGMVSAGRRLADRAGPPLLRQARWQQIPVGTALTEPADPADPPGGGAAARSDLVIAAYLLGELRAEALEALVLACWAGTGAELVLVEPGTPAGYARVLAARAALLAAGATITAPCPSDARCPLTGTDWCHFARRVARTAEHRRIKTADRGFEDEKYSYLVASRQSPAHAAARVLRAPQVRSGHVRLQLCEAPQARTVVVARSGRDAYRWARSARWGDPVPAQLLR